MFASVLILLTFPLPMQRDAQSIQWSDFGTRTKDPVITRALCMHGCASTLDFSSADDVSLTDDEKWILDLAELVVPLTRCVARWHP